MRAASQLKVLCGRFEVTLAVVGAHESEAEAEARLPGDLRAACASFIVVGRTAAINRLLRRIRSRQARVLLEAFWPVSPEFAPFRPALAELGRRLAGERFDVVHCFRLHTGQLGLLRRQGIGICRSVLDLDDHESRARLRLVRYISAVVGRQLAAVHRLEALKWAALERLLIPSFDDLLVCSTADLQRLRRRFPRNRWHVVPNIVAEPVRLGAVEHPFSFLFVGSLDYSPNVDAVVFFCTGVLPILRRLASAPFKVLIIGRGPGELARFTALEGVEVIGDPPEVAPYYARADVAIVPLRAGGGTRIKILEAFSYGIPVISTTVGAEGLDVTADKDILIADSPEAFASHCCRMLDDEPLRRHIAAAGRNLWRKRYDPEALRAALTAAYEGGSGKLARPH